jgi:hypothetical protein
LHDELCLTSHARAKVKNTDISGGIFKSYRSISYSFELPPLLWNAATWPSAILCWGDAANTSDRWLMAEIDRNTSIAESVQITFIVVSSYHEASSVVARRPVLGCTK